MILNYIVILKLYFWNILEQKYVHRDYFWWNQVLLHRIKWQTQLNIYPLSKITSQGPPDDDNVPKKRPDVLRTSPYGPICNTKGSICSGTSSGCTQDVNLTIIHKMSLTIFLLFFLIPTVYQTL